MRFQATDFNPRSPYGERPCFMVLFSQRAGFQSTLPLRGATHTSHHPCWDAKFQSTLPLRGATGGKMGLTPPIEISIHAPLTGSDQGGTRCVCRPVYFNPRSPYGERRILPGANLFVFYFNPRSPYGERPHHKMSHSNSPRFQSTLPLRGATISAIFSSFMRSFQSTLPLRGATNATGTWSWISGISIHAPLTGSDNFQLDFCAFSTISIHAPLTGSD